MTNRTMTKISAFLHSPAAVFVLLFLALMAQTPHTASVFQRLAADAGGEWWQSAAGWMHAGFYAVALEFATLLFVVRGNRSLSWTFAVVSVAANVAYYWRDGMTISYMASAALISLALPACIAFYSHDVAEESQPQPVAKVADTPAPARQRRQAKVAAPEPAPDTAEAEIEALLAGVQMDGTPTMAEYWQASHQRTGKIGSADELTAQRFGVKPRTVRQRRSAGWEVAA